MVKSGVRFVLLWSDPHMSLTDTKIRSLKPSDKPFKVSDSHGLHLLVKLSGSRHWYLKYRIKGKV